MQAITGPTRRHAIAAIGAATATVGISTAHPGDAPASTPIQGLFRQWQAANARANGADDSDFDAALDTVNELERRIADTPSQTVADLAAKVVAISGDGGFDLSENAGPNNPKLWAEIRGVLA
ncbi:twin-arginine translocation signal domain-containing protein [Gymnodinialimonas sp.]